MRMGLTVAALAFLGTPVLAEEDDDNKPKTIGEKCAMQTQFGYTEELFIAHVEKIEDPKQAIADCTAAAKAEPENAAYRFYLGRALIEIGETEKGQKFIREAYARGNGSAAYLLCHIEIVLEKQKEDKKEQADYKQAVRYCLRAGATGIFDAYFIAGMAYKHGVAGVGESPDLAVAYLKLAAFGRHEQAFTELAGALWQRPHRQTPPWSMIAQSLRFGVTLGIDDAKKELNRINTELEASICKAVTAAFAPTLDKNNTNAAAARNNYCMNLMAVEKVRFTAECLMLNQARARNDLAQCKKDMGDFPTGLAAHVDTLLLFTDY